MLLELTTITKRFPGVLALDDARFDLKAGEVHAFMGENGAGKSTMMKIASGLFPPDAGDVRLGGQLVTFATPADAKAAGIHTVFQELTVYQNLYPALRRKHAPGEIPDEISHHLERIRLPGIEDRKVSELSHGQQQWLSIAMSLACEPELLLLDEPTAGLSTEETEQTSQIIHEVNDRGVTIIVIEHDMDFIESLKARTSVLHYGRLFAQGSFEEIAAHEGVHQIYLGTA